MVRKYFFNLSKSNKIQLIEKFLLANQVTESELKLSIRSDKSIYNKMCEYLEVKNNRKNKLRLYQFIYIQRNGLINRISTPTYTNDNSLFFNDSLLSEITKPNPTNDNGIVENVFLTNEPLGLKPMMENSSESVSDKQKLSSSSSEERNSTNFYCNAETCTKSQSSEVEQNKLLKFQEVTPEEKIPKVAISSSSEATSVLPRGATNITKTTFSRNRYNECKFLEGVIDLGKQYKKVFHGNNFNYILKKKIKKKVNNICSLIIKNKRVNKSNCVVYGRCIHMECKLFLIKIKNSGIASVYSTGQNFNHTSNKTDQVRGVKRLVARKALFKQKPLKHRVSNILKARNDLLHLGNLQDVKSDVVYRKIRSEALSRLDRDKDDVIDLIKMKRDHPEYIQFVGEPFQIHLFSVEQLKMIAAKKVHNERILYLDATGTLPRAPKNENKKCFYYCLVTELEFNKRLCPVLEMLLCQHDSSTIGYGFLNFQKFCVKNGLEWPPFERIVTDFSFAMINTVMRFCNEMTLENYLTKTFESLTKGSILQKDIVKLHICCCHFMKIISNDVNKCMGQNVTGDGVGRNTKENCSKTVLKNILAAPFNINNYNLMKMWFKDTVIILNSKFKSPLFNKTYNHLLALCIKNLGDDLCSSTEARETYSSPHINDNKVKYKNSPFYQEFYKIYLEVLEEMKEKDTEGEQNPLYAPKLLNDVLIKYIPYLPLWSGLLAEGKRYSNAPVESWNNILKNNIMEGQKYVKTSRIIRKSREYILGIYKEMVFNISKSSLNIKKKKDDKGVLLEEKWNRKPKTGKRNFGFHKMIALKQMQPKVIAHSPPSNKKNEIVDSFSEVQPESNDKLWNTLVEDNIEDAEHPLLELFNNGLVQNPAHYKFLNGINFPVLSYGTSKLFVKDFENLVSCSSEILIEVSLKMIHKKYRTESLLLPLGDIFSLSEFQFTDNFGSPISGPRIYKPIHFGNKYMLLIVDACSKKMTLLNGSSDVMKLIMSFVDKLKNYTTETIRNDTGEHNDLFLLNTIESALSKKSIDIRKYASNLIGDLLKYSDNMKKTCLYCFNTHELATMTWIMCDCCCRWVHLTCLKESSLSEADFKTTTFRCHLCESYEFEKSIPIQKLEQPQKFYSEINYIMAQYYNDNFKHCEIKELEYSDYSTLSIGKREKDMWLTNFIIDLCIGCFLQMNPRSKNNFTAVNCNTSSIIFRTFCSNLEEAEIFTNEQLDKIPPLKGILLLPTNIEGSHWVLCVADADQRTFTFIDPQGSTRQNKSEYYAIFLSTFARYHQKNGLCNFSVDDWTHLEPPKHPIQKDNVNCGVFVLMFAELIIKGEEIEKGSDPITYRNYLKRILIENGSNVRNPPSNHIIKQDPMDPINFL